MPLITTVTNLSTGHDGGCGPVRCITGSPTMFVDFLPVTRIGDFYEAHGCPVHPTHNGRLSTGSTVLFVDFRAVGRIGDLIADGGCPESHKVAEGHEVMNVVD